MIKKLLASVTLIALIFACGGGQEKSNENTGKKSKKEASIDSKKIYRTNCVVCHGMYGDMGASGANNLTESTLPIEERIAIIANGKNVMTAFKNVLTEEEIAAVAEYTLTLKE